MNRVASGNHCAFKVQYLTFSQILTSARWRVFKLFEPVYQTVWFPSWRIFKIASISLAELENPAPAFDWAAIRSDYEAGGMKVMAVAVKHGVTVAALRAASKRAGWNLRRVASSTNRSSLISRMFRLLDRQITQLEATMAKSGDKEVAVLGNLARTLEKLIEIEDAEKPKRSTKAHSKDMQDIRRKLEKRIDDLTKG
jgi:hypothetical protein